MYDTFFKNIKISDTIASVLFFSLLLQKFAIAADTISDRVKLHNRKDVRSMKCNDIYKDATNRVIITLSGSPGMNIYPIINRVTMLDENIKFIPSITTKTNDTPNDQDKHYFFVTKDEFKSLDKAKELLSKSNYSNYSYGISKSKVLNVLYAGYDIILSSNTSISDQLLQKSIAYVVSIYIMPQSISSIISTLTEKGMSKNQIDESIKYFISSIKSSGDYDFILFADEVLSVAQDILKIYHASSLLVKSCNNGPQSLQSILREADILNIKY